MKAKIKGISGKINQHREKRNAEGTGCTFISFSSIYKAF
jgi:hypothetical protein